MPAIIANPNVATNIPDFSMAGFYDAWASFGRGLLAAYLKQQQSNYSLRLLIRHRLFSTPGKRYK
jgi:hypothetical protein